MITRSLVVAAAIPTMLCAPASAQCDASGLTELFAEDYADDDRFGGAVAIDGDVAVAGAWKDDDHGERSGSAYVFRLVGGSWEQEQKLTASDAAAEDRFGWSVSIAGDAIAVGAIQGVGGPGAVYVFRYDGAGWVEEQKLGPSGTSRFGWSLSIEADRLGVGSPSIGGDPGTYVFQFDGAQWTQQTLLTVDLGGSFGDAVALSGDRLAVGKGVVRTYRWDGNDWIDDGTVESPTPLESDDFGTTVALNGDVLVVGAPGAVTGDTGDAYVFRQEAGTWELGQTLVPLDPETTDEFGSGVAIEASIILVGDNTNEGSCFSNNCGAVYVFAYDGASWEQHAKLGGTSSASGLGGAVAISGAAGVAGAEGDNPPVGFQDSGTALLIRGLDDCDRDGTLDLCQVQEVETDCNRNGVVDSCDIADGTSTDADGDGRPDECGCLVEPLDVLWAEPPGSQSFGSALAAAGDRLLVGSTNEEAYVWCREGAGWMQEQMLTASDADRDDDFGRSVALGDQIAFVGASGDDDLGSNSGSVYVYRRLEEVWVETDKLLAPDGTAFDRFGRVMAADGSWLAVAAPGVDAVYVVRDDDGNWVDGDKLEPSPNPGVQSLDLVGDLLVIGGTEAIDETGAAWVYRLVGNDWLLEQMLVSPEPIPEERFGWSVAASAETILVGATYHTVSGVRVGGVHVFRFEGGTWVAEDILTAADAIPYVSFGASVDLLGNQALIGATVSSFPSDMTGAAYLFHDNAGWTQVAKLPGITIDGNAGKAVALTMGHALVGAPGEEYESGEILVFGGADDCNGNDLLDACEMQVAGDANANGILDECECIGDATLDGVVDVADLVQVILHWGDDGGSADINADGVVDILDLVEVIISWGPCPA